MKNEDIINTLNERLPFLTDFFNKTQEIESLSAINGLATIVLANDNTELQTDDWITITGAETANAILELTQTDGIATAKTTDIHDLTQTFTKTIKISGANETEYNGEFDLLTVIDGFTFTFKIDKTAPAIATGSPILHENNYGDFNGFFKITKIDSKAFTYDIKNLKNITNISQAVLNYCFRITGTASIDRTILSYTEQAAENYCIFVRVNSTTANKDKNVQQDITYYYDTSEQYRQKIIQNVNIYVIIGCNNELLGYQARDKMEEIRNVILQSVCGLPFDSYLGNKSYLTYKLDETAYYGDIQDWKSSIYVHNFEFETLFEINDNNIAPIEKTVAFRKINANYYKDDIKIKETDINLP